MTKSLDGIMKVEDLTVGQTREREQLVTQFPDVLSSIPGETKQTDHHIET